MSQPLHNFLTEQGDYTKSYEDFQAQFASEDSQKKLYDFMAEKGDYTKSSDEFYSQFFPQVVQEDLSTDDEKEEEETTKEIPTEAQVEQEQAEEAAIIEERKANVARFNALSLEEQEKEAMDAGYKDLMQDRVGEYRQSLMGAKVTTTDQIGPRKIKIRTNKVKEEEKQVDGTG